MRTAFARFVHGWPWLALLAALMLAVAGPGLLDRDPYAQDLLARNLAPSAAHWLGTDNFGRDVFARLVAGTRLTLLVASCAGLIALVAGAGLGLLACATGGGARAAVYLVFDMIRTLPPILLSLALMVALGVGTASVVVAVGISFTPLFGYVARAVYEREMASGYVRAARVLGLSSVAIAWRHVLPNIAGTLLTQLAIVVPRAVVTESVLSFFGLGVAPDVPTWGRIIATAVPFAEQAPTALLFPVVALALTSLSLSVAGNRLRRRFDPMAHPAGA
ncbi:ABC transporter permease [Bordetella genomosp. 13]|uniref:ABC transporter permease n=1 Tax=Bordetella genomosp. 13 TaxID=463040 RepID=UPI00119FB928|nr:ABC transporter permease [Bordetella genomosp. 13]